MRSPLGSSNTVTTITEADVESAALDWLRGLGWAVAHGPDGGQRSRLVSQMDIRA